MADPGLRRRAVASALLASLLTGPPVTHAQTPNAEINALRKEVEELRRRDAERQRQLEALQRRLEELDAAHATVPATPGTTAAPIAAPAAAQPQTPRADAQRALDEAVQQLGDQPPPAAPADLFSRQIGGARLRLMDLSFDLLTAAGSSTATDSELEDLEGGAHDPTRRGFTLQNAELALSGAVDPYFSGQAYVLFSEEHVELEEAFMLTSALPYGLQAKGGYFLTEFGQINPSHPHTWDWIDQPVINTRMFGGEGLRSAGARLSWLTPLPWFSEVVFGLQNAESGETTTSFISPDAVGGRPTVPRDVANLEDLLYLARWSNFTDITDSVGVKLGVSGLYGPNSSGSSADTWVYGSDLKLRWRPADNFRGWPFFLWQSEVMKRDYTADAVVAGPNQAPAVALPRAILRDYGFYTQALYGFRYGWAAGVRYEFATGNGDSVGGRSADPYRDARHRVSPLLVWHPSEYSRFRLQYNYDNATHLPDKDANSVWVGAEILYGAHPAHAY